MTKRIFSVFAVAALMAVMLVAMAAPAFASCSSGNNQAYFGPGAAHRSDQATESLDKVYYTKCPN
jgi:hypothetical protein